MSRTVGEEKDWARLLRALESIARSLERLSEDPRLVGEAKPDA